MAGDILTRTCSPVSNTRQMYYLSHSGIASICVGNIPSPGQVSEEGQANTAKFARGRISLWLNLIGICLLFASAVFLAVILQSSCVGLVQGSGRRRGH